MRDQIERVISSQHMKSCKRGHRNQGEEIQALRSIVNKLQKSFSIRSNYAHTLNALKETFGHENCFIGFYETLFTKGSYSNPCKFVGINYKEPNWQQKIHVSATSNVIPENILQNLEAGKLLCSKQLSVTSLISNLNQYGQQLALGARAK
tara:strand:- start:887 stop:1336 length:450 start_codon:yes stop_codon:yes gene_type:complete